MRPVCVVERCQATPPSSSASVTRSDTRVEERAPGPGGAGGLGDRAVEQVGQRAQHQEEEAGPQRAVADRDGGPAGEHDAGGGEVVGGDAGAADVGSDGLQALLEAGSPASVEHRGPRATGRVPRQASRQRSPAQRHPSAVSTRQSAPSAGTGGGGRRRGRPRPTASGGGRPARPPRPGARRRPRSPWTVQHGRPDRAEVEARGELVARGPARRRPARGPRRPAGPRRAPRPRPGPRPARPGPAHPAPSSTCSRASSGVSGCGHQVRGDLGGQLGRAAPRAASSASGRRRRPEGGHDHRVGVGLDRRAGWRPARRPSHAVAEHRGRAERGQAAGRPARAGRRRPTPERRRAARRGRRRAP